MGSGSRINQNTPAFLFTFFVTIGLLGAGAAVAGRAFALMSGGGVGIARFAPWVVIGSVTGAVVIAPRLRSHGADRSIETALTLGVAAAGVVTIVAVIGRDLPDLAAVGPLQITVATVAVLVVAGSPLIARLMIRYRLVERASSLTVDAESGSDDGLTTRRGLGSWQVIALVAGLAVLAAGLIYILSSGPLGHDESVYTVKARSWYAGTPSTGFGTHRPVGLAAIGWVVIHFSDSEVAFRSAGIALAIGAVTVMWFAGRSMLSPAAAWIGTGVFVASTSYLRRATEFLNDLTAAGLLLATMFVIWYHFERKPGGWWLILAAPLAAAAYYVRYGSALGSVLVAVVAGAVWIRELRSSWRQIAATAATVVVLLMPHFLYAFGKTGSPFGVLRSASTSLPSGGGGLSHYLGWFPSHLAGTLGATVMIAGAVYTIVLVVLAIRKRRWPSKTRTVVFFSASALLFTLALGAFTHGEPRFIFMPLMAALLVGGQAIAVTMTYLRRSPHRIVAVVLAVIIAHAFVTGTDDMQSVVDSITERRGRHRRHG